MCWNRKFWLLLGCILLLLSCASTPDKVAPLSSSARPAHHLPNGHFQNTDTLMPPVLDTMEADSLVPAHRTKMYALPIVRGSESLWEDSSESSATWIGHSTFYLRWNGFGILTDPIFSDRASPVVFAGPARGTPPGRVLDSLPPVQLVIISHDHYDHLDKQSIIAIARKYPNCLFAAPLRVGAILKSWGIVEKNILELDWWESRNVGSLRLTCVPAHHTSRRGLFKSSRNATLWAGWVLEKEGRKIWFAGDIAWGDGCYYKQIAEKFAPIDVSFLPLGSYKPSRYTRQHISPRQAVKLHLLVKSKNSIGMHWGTFGMVYDRLEDAPKDLARARRELSVPDSAFTVLKHGEIRELFSDE